MIRSYFLCGLGLVLAIAVSFSIAQTPSKAVDKKQTPNPEKTLRERMRENQKKLNASIDFAGVDDPRTTLDEVLKDLGKRHDIFIDVNERAFEAEGLKDVKTTPLATEGRPIPAIKGVSLDYVLRKILSRIPVTSGATYINRGESLLITTGQFRFEDVYLDPDHRPRPSFAANLVGLPFIHRSFNKQPLEDALKELSEHTLINIVLDVRVAEKAQATVTGDFADVPIDTAVEVLANQADLKSVLLDNVLYVTSKEKAKVLESDYRRRRLYDEQLTEEEKAANERLQRKQHPNGVGEKQSREDEKQDERLARVKEIRVKMRKLALAA
jgi:hypothetical protein